LPLPRKPVTIDTGIISTSVAAGRSFQREAQASFCLIRTDKGAGRAKQRDDGCASPDKASWRGIIRGPFQDLDRPTPGRYIRATNRDVVAGVRHNADVIVAHDRSPYHAPQGQAIA
jgi:hypothetical protein